MKIITASRLMLLVCLLMAYAVVSQPQIVFEEKTGSENPFGALLPGGYASPALVDIDNDGDMDVFFALEDGTIVFYKNTGTYEQAFFEAQTGSENPLQAANGIAYAGIAFADVDGDGDYDAFVSSVYAWIKFYKNIGSAEQAIFELQTGENNPLDHYEEGFEGKLDFVDIDNDGDLDVFIGDDYGSIRYYKNEGTPSSPLFVEQAGANNPLDQVYAGDFAKPAFADLDLDGDFDLVIGVENGSFHYFENAGTAELPDFMELTADQNPFDNFDAGTESKPAFADLDGDGDVDLIAGNESGNIRYYQNISEITRLNQLEINSLPEISVLNNEIQIQLATQNSPLLNQQAMVKLFTLNSKLVHTTAFTLYPSVRLPLPALSKGIYLLHFQTENKIKTLRFGL